MTDSSFRLKKARTKRGYSSPTDAARAFGWNVNTYRSHENGNRELSKSAALKYAKAYQVSVEWLLFGKGHINELTHQKQTKSPIKLLEEIEKNTIKIPRIQPDRLYIDLINIIDNKPLENVEYVTGFANDQFDNQLFETKIEDNSLEEVPVQSGYSIRKNTSLVFGEAKDIVPGDIVVALLKDQQKAIIRRFRIIEEHQDNETTVELYPPNQDYPTIRIKDKISEIIVAKLLYSISIHLS